MGPTYALHQYTKCTKTQYMSIKSNTNSNLSSKRKPCTDYYRRLITVSVIQCRSELAIPQASHWRLPLRRYRKRLPGELVARATSLVMYELGVVVQSRGLLPQRKPVSVDQWTPNPGACLDPACGTLLACRSL